MTRLLWHVSPSCNRQRILTRGLEVRASMFANVQRPAGVYCFTDEQAARAWAKLMGLEMALGADAPSEGIDLWGVACTQHVLPDPHIPDHVRDEPDAELRERYTARLSAIDELLASWAVYVKDAIEPGQLSHVRCLSDSDRIEGAPRQLIARVEQAENR